MRIRLFFRLVAFIFKKTFHKQLFVLISTPCYGNIGDHAILLAEKELLSAAVPSRCVFEFTSTEYKKLNKYIKLRKNDVVLIDGGGNFGDTWPETANQICEIVKKFYLSKIFIFPESWYFSNTPSGEAILNEMIQAFSNNDNVVIYARDSWSFKQMTNFLTKARVHLAFDCVFYKQILLPSKDETRTDCVVGICLRDDRENNRVSLDNETLTKALISKHFVIKTIKNDCYRQIKKAERIKYFEDKIAEYASCDVVVTDRFHGFVFALLCNKPCILLDNLTGKVRHSFDDLKPYIKNCFCLENTDGTPYLLELISSVIGKKSTTNDFDKVVNEYRQILINDLKRMKSKYED